MKRRVEAPMTIHMTSLPRAERAAKKMCTVDLSIACFRFKVYINSQMFDS